MSEIDLNSDDMKAKIAALKETLGEAIKEGEKGDSGPPVDPATTGHVDTDGAEIKGSDINWDDYELDPTYAHYYPRATLRETGTGIRWVVQVPEFTSASKGYSSSGFTEKGEPKGLGDYLTWMTNSNEGWKVVGVYPNGTGFAGILLQRIVNLALPEPKLVETTATVAPVTDTELQETEDAAAVWAGDTETAVEGADA